MTSERTVVVASTNPSKVGAVEAAFARVLPGPWDVTGIAVNSGVAEQPSTEEETIRGAWNRARVARSVSDAEYVVAIEGGVGHTDMACAWVVILDREGRHGIAATAHIMLPPPFLREMRNGTPLDVLREREFGASNAGRAAGYFGVATNNAVTRPRADSDAVAFALAPFVHPAVFFGADGSQ